MLYQKIRGEIKKAVEKAVKEKISWEEIEESKQGDFSFKTFQLGKKLKKNPALMAREVVEKISKGRYIKKIEAKGPYVNFFLNYEKILPELEVKEEYGQGNPKKEKIILEHTSVNPSGPIHVGRVRNSFIGDSLARILKFSGYKVETHFYVNDIGKQIAIIAQGYEEGLEYEKKTREKYKAYQDKEDFQVFFEYVTANKKFEKDKTFQKKVQEKIKKAESGDKKALNEIRKVAKKCLKGQKKTFERLKIKFDFFDFESKYLENKSVEKILALLKKSKYAQEVGGSLGLNLEEFKLKRKEGLTVLSRKDGTSVYLSRDLAYHLEKAKLGDRMINVLGEDHKFEFLEVKTILKEILHIPKALEVVHFSFVNFEGESLSTRKGATAPVDKLIDEAIEKAEREIERRKIARKETALKIGIGAIKYRLLKTSPEKPITFKWEEALDFEGDACPYIQYSHARCCSILRKFKGKIKPPKESGKLIDEEKELLKEIIRFPFQIEKAAQERKPNLIANYLYHFSNKFSRFYKNCQVLGVEREIEGRRIFLVNSARIVLKNGLSLLGIEAPERM